MYPTRFVRPPSPPRDEQPTTHPTPPDGQPVWPLAAMLFPPQGDWTPDDFLDLDLPRVELVDGRLEFLPVANELHQKIVYFFLRLLIDLLRPTHRGEVMFAPFKVRTIGRNFREPDIAVMLAANYDRRTSGHWRGADFVIEVVSPDDPDRDYVAKRAEYAASGVREYWVVDPTRRTVTLLTLDATGPTADPSVSPPAYREVGVYPVGQRAVSTLLPEFSVEVLDLFPPEPDQPAAQTTA